MQKLKYGGSQQESLLIDLLRHSPLLPTAAIHRSLEFTNARVASGVPDSDFGIRRYQQKSSFQTFKLFGIVFHDRNTLQSPKTLIVYIGGISS